APVDDGEAVPIRPADEGIVASLAVDDVRTIPAGEVVVARAAGNKVAAVSAEDRIVTLLTLDRVVARKAVDRVVPRRADERVVAGSAIDGASGRGRRRRRRRPEDVDVGRRERRMVGDRGDELRRAWPVTIGVVIEIARTRVV